MENYYFHKGDRVKLTSKGLRHFSFNDVAYNEKTQGVVVGNGMRKDMVRVLRDGLVTPAKYHSSFWQRAYGDFKKYY